MKSVKKKPVPTHKEVFVKRITREILSGKWNPGDKLPSERELAAEMGMGKTVVHNGFEQLAAMGLVYIKPKSGIFVADYMKTGNIETLNAIVNLNGDELGRDVVEAILDLRLAIEGMALRALCLCRSEDDIAHLRSITEDIRDCSDNMGVEELAERFFLWHREICILSGKSVLTLFMNTVHDVSIAFWVKYLRMYGTSFAIERLERFIGFIEARDCEGAYNLLATGIDDYLANLEKQTM
ncbi:FadR/GntR family transcriptional regulator [Lutispora thermophila]|uniref:DNA-binding transcriptional regulator, FadR family n=1 Tax=Lutispora thermophila DSM 19022 TaxID=1122184 RepID=A0A1M6D089_9FIRM|nr:GntR family transcriptional regulator [Lutispora thermophila]SHI66619.1 DNA-binding transcriptional regulator, FadR family [Lutispora thermophila DSM 19022]